MQLCIKIIADYRRIATKRMGFVVEGRMQSELLACFLGIARPCAW